MKKLIVAMSVLMCLGAHAERWIYQSDNGSDKTYLDVDSLRKFDDYGLIKDAWVKVDMTNGQTLIIRFEVHCPTKMVRYTSGFTYEKGLIVNSERNPYDPWTKPVPNSHEKRWATTICNTQILKN